MAHVWIETASGWEARKLELGQYDLASVEGLRAGNAKPGVHGAKAARLVRADAGGSRVWALAASHDSGIRVNGRATPAGLCVLTDRDEIRTAGGVQYFFSTESLAVVEEFPTPERQVFCGRCRQVIPAGSPAVRCPNCGVWYNQSPALPCWTYADKCTFCGHATALDAGFKWTPED